MRGRLGSADACWLPYIDDLLPWLEDVPERPREDVDEPREREDSKEHPEHHDVRLDCSRVRLYEFGLGPKRDQRPHVRDRDADRPEGPESEHDGNTYSRDDLEQQHDEDDIVHGRCDDSDLGGCHAPIQQHDDAEARPQCERQTCDLECVQPDGDSVPPRDGAWQEEREQMPPQDYEDPPVERNRSPEQLAALEELGRQA